MLKKKGVTPQIIERAFKGKPLTEEQKENNRIKSKTRCLVEHVFGFVTNSMNDFTYNQLDFNVQNALSD
jgi:IS5 family transposase